MLGVFHVFHIRGIRGSGALVLGEGIIYLMFLACIGLAFHMLKTCSIIVPLKYIEYGVYVDITILYTTPYSIYLRGTIFP